MRSEHEVNQAIEQYADLVRRICFLHLKNEHDTEDIFQNVFLKYVLFRGTFESPEHEKAWFTRVTINACKDLLKSFYRNRVISIDSISEEEFSFTPEQSTILQAVLALPPKYKDVIYLFYFEGYTAVEIAQILKKRENTIYSLLSRGRGILKTQLGGEDFE